MISIAQDGCPSFPDVLQDDQLERLLDQIRPDLVELVWAEPFNDRNNWRAVRDGYQPGSFGHKWMTQVFEQKQKQLWSQYATELYVRLRDKAQLEGWLHKLRYLLYETDITQEDSACFEGLEGVLLQSKPGEDGRSQNPHFARFQ